MKKSKKKFSFNSRVLTTKYPERTEPIGACSGSDGPSPPLCKWLSEELKPDVGRWHRKLQAEVSRRVAAEKQRDIALKEAAIAKSEAAELREALEKLRRSKSTKE